MEFETLKLDTNGAIGSLTLSRPGKLNALSVQVLQEIERAAHWFDARPEIRVVIVRGDGRAFTAGADLGDSARSLERMKEMTWVERREIGYTGSRMASALEGMRALTIAQLHGYCIGGGCVIATACDFRIAADDTVFSIPEVDLGIPLSWGGIPRLVREIGPLKTKELVITCRRFDAVEAAALGLINETVPAAQLEARVTALAQELAAKPSVPALQTKAQVNAYANALAVTAFADGDLLVGARSDPDSQAAAMEYAQRVFGKNRGHAD